MRRFEKRRGRVSVNVPRGLRQSCCSITTFWTYADDLHSNFRLLIDKETGAIFLGDHQV